MKQKYYVRSVPFNHMIFIIFFILSFLVIFANENGINQLENKCNESENKINQLEIKCNELENKIEDIMNTM